MKKICFAQMKGGTGKTTIAFNVACMLAEHSRVLVIDCDSQCNLSSNLRFNIFDEEAYTVADLFENLDTDPLDILVQLPLEALPNLDLFPSTMYLSGTQVLLYSKPYREQYLKKYMERNNKFFSYYDYIIFDTGPNVEIINQNAFLVADDIILVTDPDCNSAQGADVFLRLWNSAREFSEKEDNVSGLVINNVEKTKISSKMENYVNNHPVLSKIRFQTMIPHTTRFKECADQNLPIQLLEAKGTFMNESKKRAERAINSLIAEMSERGIL